MKQTPMFIATKDSPDIADFMAFLSACYGGAPEALEREGASDEEIAKIAALADGHDLPPFYVAYLRLFGRKQGRTKWIANDGAGTVEWILDHYADAAERYNTPPGGLVVGVGGLMHSHMLVWPPADGEPHVGAWLGGKVIEYFVAVSFRHLCYQATWEAARFVGSGTMMEKKGRMLAEVELVFAQHGASKYWFSDEYGVYAESDRIACAARFEAGKTWVSVAAHSQKEREALRNELRLALGFSGH